MNCQVSVVLGTRPEIIKMAPVLGIFRLRKVPHTVIHTRQHTNPSMSGLFVRELSLKNPGTFLTPRWTQREGRLEQYCEDLEKAFRRLRPRLVLVVGDTDSVRAAAIAADRRKIPLAHIEAGLRSFDRSMPEEHNRIVADHLAELLFAPTRRSHDNLLREQIPPDRIHLCGHPVYDAVRQFLPSRQEQKRWVREHGCEPERYLLATVHRKANIEDRCRLRDLLRTLRRVGNEFELPVLWPVHPRTHAQIRRFGLLGELPRGTIRPLPPLGYREFLSLEARAVLVLTDSGGVQEECCILKVPCVTLRDNTERPETIDVGANVLAGTDPARVVRACRGMMRTSRSWRHPYGDGRAAQRISTEIKRFLRGLAKSALPSQ